MLDNFIFTVNAVLPIILLIGVGCLLRAIGLVDKPFLMRCNKLAFNVFMPCTVFCSIYSSSGLENIRWDSVLFAVGMLLVLFFLGLGTSYFFIKERGSRGSALQCVFRSNTALIGLALATALGGEPAAAVMALILAFAIPILNLLAIIALTVFSDNTEHKTTWKDILYRISRNPLTIAALITLGILVIRSFIPKGVDGNAVFTIQKNLPFLYTAIKNLNNIASPFALVVLGGLFDFSSTKGKLGYILFGTIWRIVLAPVIAIGTALLLNALKITHFGPPEFASFLPFFGSPVAVSSSVMASEMGADDELARQYVLWTSLALVLTLPLAIMIMKSTGLL